MKYVLLIAALVLTIPGFNASAANVATDFLVSCPDIGFMARPQIGIDKKGKSTVVWVSATTILGRQFDADGIAISQPFIVEQTGMQIYDLLLAVSDSGHYVVGWTAGASTRGFFIKRYNRDGTYFDYDPIEVHANVNINTAKCAINNRGDCAYTCEPATSGAGMHSRILLPSNEEVALPSGSGFDSWPYIAISDNRRVVSVIGNPLDGIWHRSGDYSSGLTWNDAGAYAADNGYVRSSKTIDVDMTRSGEYWIAWRDDNTVNSVVFCRRYYATGAPFAGTITVSETLPWATLDESVMIDIGATGYAVVKWCAEKTVGNDVPYMCIFSPTGVARTGSLPVFNHAASKNINFHSSCLAIDSSGAPIAVCNAEETVLLQRYNNNGGIDGPQLMANIGSSPANPVAVVSHRRELAAVVWETMDSGKIAVKRYVNRNNYLGLVKNPVNSTGAGRNPVIALNGDSIGVAWQDLRDGETVASIYFQLIDSTMTEVGTNRRLSDLGASCAYPSIAAGSSRYFVVWQDVRTANGTTAHIYGQFCTKTGATTGGNFHISQATNGGAAPVVVSNGANAFVVVWAKSAGTFPLLSSSVFAQRYNGTGAKVGDTIRISGGFIPAAAMDTAGNLAVAWTSLTGQVYCRVVSISGADKVSEFKVDTGTVNKSNVSVGMNAQGAFVVAWRVLQGGVARIESRTFNADGTPQTGIRQHSDAALRHISPMPSIAAGDTTMLLVWRNTFCIDTTELDVWGEISSLVDHSATSVGNPPVHATASIQSSPSSHIAYVYNFRGQCLATIQNGITIPSLPRGFYFIRADRDVSSKAYKAFILDSRMIHSEK